MTPLGYPEVPKDLKELVRALLNILDALVPMHQLKIMHRDLRWDNILLYCSGGQNWFIIDFDDSTQLTKKGRDWIIHQAKDAQDMDPASHAPELYNSTHDEKVDIWSIGYLIETSHYFNLSPEIFKVKIRPDRRYTWDQYPPTDGIIRIRMRCIRILPPHGHAMDRS